MQRTTGAPEQAKPDVKLKKKSKEKDGTGAKRKLKDKDEAGTKKSRRKSVVPGGVSPRTEAASPFKPNALDPKVKGHVTPEKKRVSTPAMIDPVKAAKEASTLGDMSVAQKWKMPVLKKLPGDVKGAGFFDGSLGGFSGGTRRSSDTSMSSRAPQPTLAILTEIAQSKKRRMEQELRDKLNGISERVNKALLNAGFDVNEDNITFDRKQAGTFQLMSVEARSKREKVDYRNNITSNIHEYYGACKERLNILDQVSTWIGYTQDDLERDLVPDEEYMNAITLNEQSYHDTSNAMFFYTDTTERLKTISQLILKHIRRILDKKDRHVATKIIVMDDHTLLSSKVKWDTGIAAITHLIDDAIKWVKAIQLKAALRNGKKQYAFLVKAIDKRLLDLANTTKNYEETKTKLNTSIAKEEGFLKDQSDARREILNLQNTLDDLNNQIKMSKDRNEKLLIKVGKLEIQVRDLKDELAKPPPSPPAIIVPEPNPELLAAPPVPKTPTPPPPPPQEPTVNVEARERIEQLEDQINDYQITISELQDRIAMLENSAVKEQNKIKMMRAALDKSNKMLSQAQMSAPPAVTVAPELKMDIKMDIQPDAGSGGSGSGSGGAGGGGQEAANAFKLSEASANYYKTLLSGMKNDFMQEMDRLKEHVKKEGNRTEAAVRRTENVHKDQIAVIQKDAMRILRALMHFRDQVAVALEKEGHAEPATQLRALPKLIPDDIGTDAKDILSHMSGSVVEFLHSVESILNHTLMTIRIMSKFTGGPGNEGGFMKQIVDRVEKMKTAKAVSKDSAHRLRTKKRTMIKKKEDFQADQSEDKYSALMGRYKIVWNMFLSMTKEMDILEEDFEDTLEKVAENVDPLFISAMKLEAKRLREKQKALAAGENIKLKQGEGVDTKTQKPDTKFQYILRIRHHRQNIKILDKALDEKKITFELYEKSKNTLKTGITLCEKRFHLLVQRYKTFKDLQTSNVKGKKLLNGDVYLPTAKRPDLQKLLKKIETRLSEDYKFQQTIRDTALEEQNTVTKDIWTMCNHVLAQTNVELILPVVIQIKESSDGYILPMISHRQKDRMQNILNRRKALEKLRLPPILQGSNITLRNKLFYTHFKQEAAKPVNAMVTTPVVVDMDVNKERNAAKKTLTNTEKREVSLAKTRSYHVTQDWRVNFINEILYT